MSVNVVNASDCGHVTCCRLVRCCIAHCRRASNLARASEWRSCCCRQQTVRRCRTAARPGKHGSVTAARRRRRPSVTVTVDVSIGRRTTTTTPVRRACRLPSRSTQTSVISHLINSSVLSTATLTVSQTLLHTNVLIYYYCYYYYYYYYYYWQ